MDHYMMNTSIHSEFSMERALIELNFEGKITECQTHSIILIHKHSKIFARMVARGAHTGTINKLISILVLQNLEPVQNRVLIWGSDNTTSGDICLTDRGIKVIKPPHSGMVRTSFISIGEKNVQFSGDTNDTLFSVER